MASMDIAEVLLPEMTILDYPTFKDQADMFQFMAGKLEENGIVSSAEKFIEALYVRESEGSTYMGQALALPHGICDEVLEPGVAFCRVREPFLYRSKDEEGMVKYIFMMAIQKGGANDHLQMLASLARLLAHDEFFESLETVQSHGELMKAISDLQKEVDE